MQGKAFGMVCTPGFDVINGALEVGKHILAFEEVFLLHLLVLRLQAARQLLQLLCEQHLTLQLRLHCMCRTMFTCQSAF